MNLEVLISTMNETDNKNLIQEMNIKTPSITINQITKENIYSETVEKSKNKIYSYRAIGLSKSRNKAISNATGDICVIADNDVRYVNNYEQIILDSYNKNPDYDIIIFNVENGNTNRKRGRIKNDSKINTFTAMRIVSSQITFRRKEILNIPFDEDFGAGTYFNRGEETIWLVDCLKKHKKIKYIDKTIANIQEKESTWFNGYNREFLKKQGAVFYRMMPNCYPILFIQYTIRKYKLYKENTTMHEAIKLMLQGKKEYEERNVKSK